MKVTFDPAASDDLDRAFAWIARDNPQAAFELIERIRARVLRLETPQLTYMGRPGLVSGTRELVEWHISSSTGWTRRWARLSSLLSFTERETARKSSIRDEPRRQTEEDDPICDS